MTAFRLSRAALMRATLATLCAATLATTVGGCAPLLLGGIAAGGVLVATDRRTSGTQLEDEGIELRSASRLREQLGERGHINVTSFNRQALLTGEVPSEADKATAERTVTQVDNVRGVVNELVVAGTSTLSQRSNDALVSGRVKAALVDARDLTVYAFKVVTERGTVYLLGRVTQREASRATDVVRGVQGVQRVVRVLEIITEEELARLAPKPAAAPASAPPQQ
jgi:osmotically-inducible protein OsmY